MADLYNLQRFVDAQNPVYDQVCSELKRGRKTSHWMWFIFPQIEGLGHSSMAQKFAISSLEEATAYLEHPLLGPRLRECTKLVNAINNRTVDEIFGYPDNMKFRSSMTLFAYGAPDQEFDEAIRKYFNSKYDDRTVSLIAA